MKLTTALIASLACTSLRITGFAQQPTPAAPAPAPGRGTVPSDPSVTNNRSTNADPSLNAEGANAGGSNIDALFARLDTNKDGNISLEEFHAGALFLATRQPSAPTYSTGTRGSGSAIGSANSADETGPGSVKK